MTPHLGISKHSQYKYSPAYAFHYGEFKLALGFLAYLGISLLVFYALAYPSMMVMMFSRRNAECLPPSDYDSISNGFYVRFSHRPSSYKEALISVCTCSVVGRVFSKSETLLFKFLWSRP